MRSGSLLRETRAYRECKNTNKVRGQPIFSIPGLSPVLLTVNLLCDLDLFESINEGDGKVQAWPVNRIGQLTEPKNDPNVAFLDNVEAKRRYQRTNRSKH